MVSQAAKKLYIQFYRKKSPPDPQPSAQIKNGYQKILTIRLFKELQICMSAIETTRFKDQIPGYIHYLLGCTTESIPRSMERYHCHCLLSLCFPMSIKEYPFKICIRVFTRFNRHEAFQRKAFQ